MKILVLGATGGIGIELVRQAIKRGHSVTALVRSPQPLSQFASGLSVLKGDLLDRSQLESAMMGQDIVLSAFGPRVPIAKGDAHLLRDFASALVPAMQQAKVHRALVVSTAFLFKDALLPPVHLLGRLFFPGVVADATEMESTLSNSGLDIVLVRPPQLTDKPAAGRYRVREQHLPLFGLSIARADVAAFMLQVTEENRFHKTVIGLAS